MSLYNDGEAAAVERLVASRRRTAEAKAMARRNEAEAKAAHDAVVARALAEVDEVSNAAVSDKAEAAYNESFARMAKPEVHTS